MSHQKKNTSSQNPLMQNTHINLQILESFFFQKHNGINNEYNVESLMNLKHNFS